MLKGIARLVEFYETLYLKFEEVYWGIGGDMNARTGNLHDFIHTYNLQQKLDPAGGLDEI